MKPPASPDLDGTVVAGDAGPSTQRSAEARVRVRYAETDQMGFAYYANYLVWFEVGRGQFCDDLGLSYRELESNAGLYMVVAEAHCRYRRPARYDDELVIRTTATELTRRTMRFAYVVCRADDVIATGETLHVLVDAHGRPSSFPESHLSTLRRGMGLVQA